MTSKLILFSNFLWCFFTYAQTDSSVFEIKYFQSCNFCASTGVDAILYSYDGGSIYSYKHSDSTITLQMQNTSVIFDTAKKYIGYNHNTDSIFEQVNMNTINQQGVLIGEKFSVIDWVVTDSIKRFDGWNCRLAKGIFKGRQYYAWYTEEIPVRQGPWKLHGLPGAILHAKDSENKIFFQALGVRKLSLDELSKLISIPNLPVVSRAKYEAHLSQKISKLKNNIQANDYSNVKVRVSVNVESMELD